MNKTTQYLRVLAVMVMVGAFVMLFTASRVSAATISVDVNDGSCVASSGQGNPYGVRYCNIQAAIADAAPGDVISVANGTYTGALNITKDGITLTGESEAGVIIDGTAVSDYHITVKADNVTLENFTLNGNATSQGSYGLKVEGESTTTRNTGFTVANVTVNHTYRTGIDINGLDGVTVTNVTISDVPSGNGVTLTDVVNANLNGITTSNNAWGGVAIYTHGRYYPLGSDNITIDNLSGNEVTLLYVERGNYHDPLNPAPVTNLVTPQFTHMVENPTYRGPLSPNFTHYLPDAASAQAFALALPTPQDSYVKEIASGDYVVMPGMSIQTAVDAAGDGDTVTVANGSYVEQVVIDGKNITLEGESLDTVIKGFAGMSNCFLTSGTTNNKPVVCILNASDVTVQNLTIDGDGKGNGNYRFAGIAYRNSGGTVQNTVIKGISETPMNGTQHGIGAYLFNDDGTLRSFNFYNNEVFGFQKNGTAFNTDATTPLVVDIQGNVITGSGPVGFIAQNGIQISGDLISGTISDNVVSGIGYTGSSTVATSILNFNGDVDITNNTVTGGHMGIYNVDGASNVSGNLVSTEKIGFYAFGIIATDPPEAVPAPVDTPAGPAGGRGVEALLNVTVDDNFVYFNGADNSGSYGVTAEAGYGVDDIAFSATSNTVSGFEVGFGFYECDPDVFTCFAGVFTSVSATNNCLANNNTGVEAITTPTVDATNNWWGAADGPSGDGSGSGAAVSGNVAFEPFNSTGCALGEGQWFNETRGMFFDTLQEALNAAQSGDVIVALGDATLAGGGVVTTDQITIKMNGATAGPGSPFLEVAAEDVFVVGPGTLDGGGSADPAIRILAGGNNFTMTDMEVAGWADGVEVASSVTSLKLVGNFIHDNTDAGLQVNSGVTLSGVVTVEGNLFKDNGGNGVTNDGTVTLDATYNSWGDVAGPAGPLGDGVGANVSFDPWTFAEMYFDMQPDEPGDQTAVAVSLGESFDVELKAEAENIYALEFAFTYDDSLLAYNGITFAAPWNGQCTDNGTVPGAVSYFCYLFLPAAEWDGGPIGTVNFTSLGFDNTTLDMDHVESEMAAVGGVRVYLNNAGYNAPSVADRDITDTNDGEINATGAFTGFIDLQGRTDDSGAVMAVYDDANGTTLMASGTSNISGSYTTAAAMGQALLFGDTYWFYADRDLYLPTTANFPVTPSTHSAALTSNLTLLNMLFLFGGDATNDDVINILDTGCIGGQYNTPGGLCSLPGSHGDVNGDGIVNILDVGLMGGNWMRTFSGPWTP